MNSEVTAYNRWGNDPGWMSKIDIDEYERLAGIGYRPEQIAMYYKIPIKDFLWYFHLVGSPLKYHYDRGQLMQQAKEGLSMSAAAQTGENVTQAQRFDKFRKAMGYKNSIDKIFFDEDS